MQENIFQSIVSDSTESEDPPRTQPDPLPHHPQVDNKKRKADNKIWSRDEEKVLAEAWVDVSDDHIIGDDQDRETFYVKVWKKLLSA